MVSFLFDRPPPSLPPLGGGVNSTALEPPGGKRRLTQRMKLADFVDVKKDTPDKVREKLQDIISAEVRKLVLEAYDQRIASGQKPLQALSEPVYYPHYQTPIRAVKVFVANKPGAYLDADDMQPVRHHLSLIHI